MIYLDYAAATPLDRRVERAMQPYLTDKFYNPSSSYLAARAVRDDYEAARRTLAQIVGARPAEIILTAGATESINLALNLVGAMPVSGEDSMTASKTMVPRMVTSAIEHPAVLEAAKVRGATILSVDGSGRINLADLKSAITDQTELISIGYANSEIGTVQDLRAVSEICAEVRQQRSKRGLLRPLVLHTDASQAAGYLDINVARLGVDMMTLNAGKCYGPKGIGLLYVRAGITLRPLIFGGGQESGWRSGTENVAGAIGFGLALELAAKKRQTETERLSKLRDLIEQFLLEEFPQAKINGHHKHRLPNILNFSIDGLDGERAVFALDERGVMVATGSACAANKNSRSQALAAIGLTSTEIDGSLRISLGRPVSVSAIDQLKPILAKTLRQQLKFGASHG